MKLLFENWRKYLIEQADTVQIKFPDDIPSDILTLADKDPEISGFVYPEEDRERAGIYFNNELVGFMTPRMESGLWRVGAIYISPDYRGKGIGSKAIIKFFEDKDASQVPIGVNNAPAQKAFTKAGFSLLQPDEILTDESDGWKYQLWGRQEPENAEIKGPEDFLYDITTSSDRIIITLLDPETKEPVESKKEDTNAYISLEKRTDVPHWEVSWSSSPKNSEKVGTIMYLMALELAKEGLSPDSYETSPDAGYIWAKFMTKNVYGVEKEKKKDFEHENDDNHFFFVFFKPNKDILDQYSDKITQKEVEGEEKVAFDPESEEKFEKYVSHEDEDFDWEELDYIEEQTEPYQRYSRKTYRIFINKLGRQGLNKYNVGNRMKKPTSRHLKSGPLGGYN